MAAANMPGRQDTKTTEQRDREALGLNGTGRPATGPDEVVARVVTAAARETIRKSVDEISNDAAELQRAIAQLQKDYGPPTKTDCFILSIFAAAVVALIYFFNKHYEIECEIKIVKRI